MRPAEFKGQDANGNWHYGFYMFSEKKQKHYILGESKDYGFQKIEVNPDTVCQYTGINDATKWDSLTDVEQNIFLSQLNDYGEKNTKKDWKGKKIFENDIIEVSPFKCYQDVSVNEAPLDMPLFDEDNPIKILIKYNINESLGVIDFLDGEYVDEYSIKIIGNSIDNPELLEAKNDET